MIYNELNKIIHENNVNDQNVLLNEQINNYIISYLIKIPCYDEINNVWYNEDNTDYLSLYNLTLTNKRINKIVNSSLIWNKLQQFIELCKKEKITDTMSYYMIIKNITIADIPYHFYVYNNLDKSQIDQKKSNDIGKCRSYDICISYLARFIDISDIVIDTRFIKSSFYAGALHSIITNDPKKLNEVCCLDKSQNTTEVVNCMSELINFNTNTSESLSTHNSVISKLFENIKIHKTTKYEYVLSNNYVIKNAILFTIGKINFIIIYNYHSDDVNNDKLTIKYYISSKSKKKISYKTIFDVEIIQYDDSIYLPSKITDIKTVMGEITSNSLIKKDSIKIDHYLKLIALLLRIGFNNKLDFDKLSSYFSEENELLTKNNKKYYKSYLLNNKLLYDLFQNENDFQDRTITPSNSVSFSEEMIIDSETLLSSVEEDMFTNKDYALFTNNSLRDILMKTNDVYSNNSEPDIDIDLINIDLIDIDLKTINKNNIIDLNNHVIDYDSKDITDDFTVETILSDSVDKENIEYESSSETSEKDVSENDDVSSDSESYSDESSEDIEHISYETSQTDTNIPQHNNGGMFSNLLQGDISNIKVLLMIIFLIVAVLGLFMVICAIGLTAIILMICVILYKHLNSQQNF